MEDIITDARALGKKIAAHARTAKFMAAAKAVSEDREAQDLLKQYETVAQTLHQKEHAQKPIEPDEKRKMADLQARIAGNSKIKDMLKHQADYLEMMERINRAIDETVEQM